MPTQHVAGRIRQVAVPDSPGGGVPRLGRHATLEHQGCVMTIEPSVLLVLGLCLLGLLAVR